MSTTRSSHIQSIMWIVKTGVCFFFVFIYWYIHIRPWFVLYHGVRHEIYLITLSFPCVPSFIFILSSFIAYHDQYKDFKVNNLFFFCSLDNCVWTLAICKLRRTWLIHMKLLGNHISNSSPVVYSSSYMLHRGRLPSYISPSFWCRCIRQRWMVIWLPKTVSKANQPSTCRMLTPTGQLSDMSKGSMCMVTH